MHGKKYLEARKHIDSKKQYSPEEAMELIKKASTTKFDGRVEVHMNLGIDVTKGEQQIRSTIVFPHNIGKTKRVAAFVTGEKEKEAKEAGADIVGAEELIDQINKTGKFDFDIAVATPDMMVKLSKVAKVLGPAGLMPNPKTDTVGPNIKKMVEEIKKGKVAFKNDAQANLHQAIGKVSMDPKHLLENFNLLVEAVRKTKPASSKGTFIKSITVAPTMGPGIQIDLTKLTV